jgi:two-component system sensor histidine kinase BaeS
MRPRLRLAHQLSALLAVTVCLALLGMAAVMAWSLRAGFVDYLNASDEERLSRFAKVVEVTLAEHPLPQWDPTPRTLGAWLAALDRWERLGGESPEPALWTPNAPGGLAERRPEPSGPRGGGRPHPGPRLSPPLPHRLQSSPEGSGFAARVSVWDDRGRRLWGGAPKRSGAHAQRMVTSSTGDTLLLRLERVDSVPAGVASGFVQRQTLAMAAVALVCLMLALLLGTWLAKRWVQRLTQVGQAASAIARGDFAIRLPQAGGDELAALSRSMNTMAQSLQTLETSRRRWMAEMSHELRTPLSVLTGEIEALQDGVRPMSPAALQSLGAEVRQLNRLVDDLHLLAMSDLQGLPCELRPTVIAPLLEAWVNRLQGRAAERGLRLQLLPPQAQARVVMDAGRMEQLVINLLENSLRYTDAPGRIEVALQREGAHWCLSVDDTPPGVAPELCERLFEPLFRVDVARRRHADSGSGLGLAIAQAIARSHGGSLQASPSALGGLRVTLRLPAA